MDIQKLRKFFEKEGRNAHSSIKQAARPLLDESSIPDGDSRKATAIRKLLSAVVTVGSVEHLRFVVEQCGASVTAPKWSSWEHPVRVAVERRHPDMLRCLVQYGLELDADNPVIFGILKRSHQSNARTLELLDTYVELGGELDVVDRNEISFLDQLIRRGRWKLVERVISHGGPTVYRSLFSERNLRVKGFTKNVLPLLVLRDNGRQCSNDFEIEALELAASHAWKRRRKSTSQSSTLEMDEWASENDAIQCWLRALRLRAERHEPPAASWRTSRTPFANIRPVSTIDELEKCIHSHFRGGGQLIVQCLLLQEMLFGVVDPAVERCALYRWDSTTSFVDFVEYVSHFDSVQLAELLTPPNSDCHDIKLSRLCDMLCRVVPRGDPAWNRAAAQFVVYAYDEHLYTRARLKREARQLTAEQRSVLTTLALDQSWMKEMNKQLIEDLLPPADLCCQQDAEEVQEAMEDA